MGNSQVKIGVSAEDLEEKGVRYEKGGFMPQLPDYLGYVFGFLLVWLVYTSYTTAVETVREPIEKISEQAVVIKDAVEEYAEASKSASALSEEASPLIVDESDESWWYSNLELLNSAISWAADYVSLKLHEMFPSEYDELQEETGNPGSPQRQRKEAVSSF